MRQALLRPCTVRTDTARKVRFSATLGQELEVELAERLHKDAISQALSYVSDIGEPSSVVITEEVKEASKRAVWHPYPDDTPER